MFHFQNAKVLQTLQAHADLVAMVTYTGSAICGWQWIFAAKNLTQVVDEKMRGSQ